MNILFFFQSIFLIAFGVAFSNILHFFIEDSLMIGEPIRSWLFVDSYSTNMSCVIITSIAFFICQFFQRKFCQFNDSYFKAKLRGYFLFVLLCLFTLMSTFYVVQVLSKYLEGHGDSAALLRGLVTIVLFALGALYAFVEMKKPEIATSKGYGRLLNLAVLASLITAGVLFNHIASPNKLRTAREDVTRVKDMKEIDQRVQRYFKDHGQVPESLKTLVSKGYLDSKHYKDPKKTVYDYTKVSKNTFQVCAHFSTPKGLLRRQEKYLYKGINYALGHRCQKTRLTLQASKTNPKAQKNLLVFRAFKGNLYTKFNSYTGRY